MLQSSLNPGYYQLRLSEFMNVPPTAPLGRPRSSGGSISSATVVQPLSSPTSTKSKVRTPKRGYDTADLESSGESADEGAQGKGDKRRQPGVKRACNECRQQKLKCDVVTEPAYIACERCRRLGLDCKIDSNFKRVGKRSRNAEMEREIVELKRRLAQYEPSSLAHGPQIKAPSDASSPSISNIPTLDQYMGSEEAVASLMDLRSGLEGGSFMRSPNGQLLLSRRIGNFLLSQDRVNELFQIFWAYYHPFLPIFDATRPPDEFYESSPLLFWVIISVAARKYTPDPSILPSLSVELTKLLWEQIAEVPQSYILVKTLCVLCTWPLPINTTSLDPTFMLSGLNMHIAMQIGLHRPSHAQDFSRFKIEYMEEELRDRVRTWASCNAVAQRVATGYGQPPPTVYDWTLVPTGAHDPGFKLPSDAENRLLIERFSNKVTQALYRNDFDPVGLVSDEQRSPLIIFLAREYHELEQKLQDPDPFSILYLHAAGLHLRLSAFFDSPTSKDYQSDLLALYTVTTTFLESAFNIISRDGNSVLAFSPNYILQMIIASGFALLKLLTSFFAEFVDLNQGHQLFNDTITAIRHISVNQNDLPSRLAEVLAQLWKYSGAAQGKFQPGSNTNGMENSLQLKVKCRMSMSLVYDSVWRWREEFQAHGRGNLETALKNPTNPDSAVESSSVSVVDQSLAPSVAPGDTTATPDELRFDNNEVFDPLNWMLDGLVDFPSDFPATFPMMGEIGGEGMM